MTEKTLHLLYLFILFGSFISSIIVYYRKTQYPYLRSFSPFLLLTLVIETTGFILGPSQEFNKVYSVFCIIELVFYFSLFHRVIRNGLTKKVLITILIGYLIFAVVNLAFIQGIIYSNYNYMLAALFIVGFCIYCLNEQFKQSTFSEIVANPFFWICLGLLIFYAGTFPIWAGTFVMLNVPAKEWDILAKALDIVNIFLYSSITVAFFSEKIFGRVKVSK